MEVWQVAGSGRIIRRLITPPLGGVYQHELHVWSNSNNVVAIIYIQGNQVDTGKI